MNKIFPHIAVFAALMFATVNGFSQVSINGPQCVVPGTDYDYYITGTWGPTDTMQVCVSGGTITDTSAASGCTVSGFPLGKVIVNWTAGSNGSITVYSSNGTATINVSVTTPFQPGMLDSASQMQMVSLDSIPAIIVCLADSGGSCAPVYVHQWQQSSDAVDWVDMPGDTSQNLSFSSPLTAATYFRRKVTIAGSGDIGFSDIAAVFIDISYSERGGNSSEKFRLGMPENLYYVYAIRHANNLNKHD